MAETAHLKSLIRTIPNYPKEGILFRDITTLLEDPAGLRRCISELIEPYRNIEIDYIAGIEARGFILGAVMAHELLCGFVPIRKKGKLPGKTIGQEYELEYGTDTLEIHKNAIPKGKTVLIVDDLLATGGTACAAISLLNQVEAKILGAAFVIDLPEVGGAAKIKEKGIDVHTIITFDGH